MRKQRALFASLEYKKHQGTQFAEIFPTMHVIFYSTWMKSDVTIL